MTPLVVHPHDAPRLAALHAETFETPWPAEAIAEVLGGPGAFGLMIDEAGAPAGFILCRAIAGEAEILTLAVRPAERRRGVARVLVTGALALAEAHGARTMFLEVADDNAAALALYAGAGFAEVGRREGYYARPAGGVAARIMRRDLNR